MPIRSDTTEADRTARQRLGRPLATLAAGAQRLRAISKGELKPGDWVIVTTRNSVYTLHANDDGTFLVAGGWFDRHAEEPNRVGVVGCTFGGQAVKTDIVAAPGLYLEFDNRVTTTRIQDARLVRDEALALH
jgi:hypothetical protein